MAGTKPGRYALVPGSYNNGWDGKAEFEARCAHDGCQNTARTDRCFQLDVPLKLRVMGWGMTGRTSAARWWCMVHAEQVGAK